MDKEALLLYRAVLLISIFGGTNLRIQQCVSLSCDQGCAYPLASLPSILPDA